MKIELKALSEKFDILSTKLIALQTEVADYCAKIEQLRADCDNDNENMSKVDTEVIFCKNSYKYVFGKNSTKG